MTVLVTGAAGLVGSAVVAALRDRGTPVLSADLASRSTSAQMMHWDLRGPVPEEIAALRARVRTVVHCARKSADWGAAEEFHAVNVAGTRAVLDTFAQARFIHLSSASVYGINRDHTQLHEEAGPLAEDQYTSAHSLTTAQAEQVVTRVQPRALILRPARVYAPGSDDGLIAELESFRRKNALHLPGGAKKPVMFAHLDTVVQAVLAGIDAPHVYGPVNVADAQACVLHDALNTYLARTDRPSVVLDSHAADLAKTRAWMQAKRAGKPTEDNRPAHTVAQIEEYVRERTYSTARLSSQLGVQPGPGLAAQD